jgi:hypothetical protein
MAFNPMQQQQSPDMLMAMMTDPRATPQQRMAAMSALNTMRGGANAPAAAADDRRRHGCERHGPRVYGRCAPGNDGPGARRAARNRTAPGRAGSAAEPGDSSPDVGRCRCQPCSGDGAGWGGEGVCGSGAVIGQDGLPPDPTELLRIATTAIDPITRFRAKAALSAMRGQAQPTAGASSERLKALVPPEMTQEEAIEKFYTEGGGRNNPQLIKDMFSNTPVISPEKAIEKLGSAIGQSAGYLYEKAEPYARRAIDYSVGSELTQDPDFVAEETRKKRMGDSVPGEERYQLESLRDFKPTIQEFPINADAAEAAVPDAVIDRRANDAKAAAADAAQALTDTPPPAAVEARQPDPAAEALNARKQEESNAHKERMDKLLGDDQPLSAQDKWMALARAGFATAAGSSPHALQNIGAGLGKGVESLDELRKERAINRMKQATLEQSRRSEELASEDRKTTAGIQQQLADVQKGRLAIERDPKSPENKERKDRGEYYRLLGLAAGKETPTQFLQKLNKLAEIRAMPKGPEQEAALEDFKTATSPDKNVSDYTVMNSVLLAGDRAVKNFNDSLSVTETVANDPKILADIEKRREKARAEGQANAARLLNVSIPGAAPPSPAGGGIMDFSSLVK